VEIFKPQNSIINFDDFSLTPKGDLIKRRLKDMSFMYQNQEAVKKLIDENPLIYEFYNVEIPEEKGHLQHCLTVLYPGKIGKEYYMTKGHFHSIKNTAEVYITFSGEGRILMQNTDDETEILKINKGVMSYIPPYYAHRTINVGKEPLVFCGVYPGDAGHEYGIIEKKGMAELIVEENDEIKIIDNPEYKN